MEQTALRRRDIFVAPILFIIFPIGEGDTIRHNAPEPNEQSGVILTLAGLALRAQGPN